MANCSDITKFGIFDVSKTSREEDLVSSYLKWLNNQENGSRQEASNTSANFGFEFPTIGLDFGGGHDTKTGTSWSKKLTEYLENNSEARTRFNQEFVTANSHIVDAWSKCVSQHLGLVCWAEQTDNPREIMLKMELRLADFTNPEIPTVKKIITSPNVRTTQQIEGETFGATRPTTIIYERIGSHRKDAVNF